MATAPDPAPIERMEELLKCSICKEILNKPTTLPCFHSFCKKCLARYIRMEVNKEHEAEHRFSCPACRSQYRVKHQGSVCGLPSGSNPFIKNLLNISKMQQQAQKMLCESCKSQLPASCRCVECEHYLCKNCLTVHNNWPAFNNHLVLSLEELAKPENQAKAKSKPRCKKHDHGNKSLEFYCNTCQELVCMTCILLDHPKPGHDYKPDGVVAEQQKETLKTTSAKLQTKSNQGQNALQKIKQAFQNLQASKKETKDAILREKKAILEKFTNELNSRTAALLAQVDQKHNEVNQKLVEQRDDMTAYAQKVNGSLEFVKSIIEKGSNEKILFLRKQIKKNVHDIKTQCPKSMLPVHYGYFEFEKSAKTTTYLENFGKIVEPLLQSLLVSSNILSGDVTLGNQLAAWLKNKSFGFELCYRASRHGWGAKDFHGKCDSVGPTVTLLKCGTNVFGGYTDQSWKSDQQTRSTRRKLTRKPKRPQAIPLELKCSEVSFLFSLRNEINLPPFKCSIYDNQIENAIRCDASRGAIFGEDLCISDNANTNQLSFSNLGHTYQPPPGYQRGTPQTKALLTGATTSLQVRLRCFTFKKGWREVLAKISITAKRLFSFAGILL